MADIISNYDKLSSFVFLGDQIKDTLKNVGSN